MKFERTFIPYGAYWSTPFCKWQGSFANTSSIDLAAQAARKALGDRQISPELFDSITLGITVPQKSSFYGSPWLGALVGAPGISGPMIGQACATGARVLASAATEVELTGQQTVLTITTDRCSNGPHIYYPNPAGPGGTGTKEDWVMDNFGNDPWARNAMIETAENVAKEAGITREEQDELTLVRHEQYQAALADDGKFQKRYMLSPFEVLDARGKKTIASVATDEGVFPTTADGLANLRPVMPEGTVTFGSQTHPADGACGMIVCDEARAKELGKSGPRVQVLSYGQARVEKGRMAKATVPASRVALDAAGLEIGQIDAIKTHNPFAVNDIYFAREFGLDPKNFNAFGSSLIFGHPQGPTGTRLVIELIEELALRGGGTGLFVGCAAGDSAAAITLKVS